MSNPKWHCNAGLTLTSKSGADCGVISCAMIVDSQEEGWKRGLEYIRNYQQKDRFYLIYSYHLEVKYY